LFLSVCRPAADGIIHLYDTSGQRACSPAWRPAFKQIRARDVGWSVVDIDYSPDGRFVAYSSWSDYVHLCNVHGEFEVSSLFSCCCFRVFVPPVSTSAGFAAFSHRPRALRFGLTCASEWRLF
jgi:hypothetical protein